MEPEQELRKFADDLKEKYPSCDEYFDSCLQELSKFCSENKKKHDKLILILLPSLRKEGWEELHSEYKLQENKSLQNELEELYEKYEISDKEEKLHDELRCDLYAERGNEKAIIEVETSLSARRLLGKAFRYSIPVDKFYMAYPKEKNPIDGKFQRDIDEIKNFLQRSCTKRDIQSFKNKEVEMKNENCTFKDYLESYKNPPISDWQLLEARLDGILLIDLEKERANLEEF